MNSIEELVVRRLAEQSPNGLAGDVMPALDAEVTRRATAIANSREFYVEARVGSENHRGDCCRALYGGGKYNDSAQDLIRVLAVRVDRDLSEAKKTAQRLLECIRTLCTSTAVTDTIWLATGCTVVEELAAIAADHGATDDQIERACSGEQQESEAGADDRDSVQ